MASKERPKQKPRGGKEPDGIWINIDNIILNSPIPFPETRAGRELLKHHSCCCCCCGGGHEKPAPASGLAVTLDLTWEIRVNVGSSTVPSSVLIVEIKAEFSWSATGGSGISVDIEARTDDLAGNPGGTFPGWTEILSNLPPADIASWRLDPNSVIGNKIRFRAKATDDAGNTAYSDIKTVTPGGLSL